MRKVFQAQGDGDCLRCCVASLLGEAKGQVPDFVTQWDDDWLPALEGWAAARGLGVRMCGPMGDSATPRQWVALVPREGELHALIVGQDRDGLVVLHDPDGTNPAEVDLTATPPRHHLHFFDPGVSPWAHY